MRSLVVMATAALLGGCASRISLLADDLDHPDRNIRTRAAESLCCMGADARRAIPALLRALSDQDARVRTYSSIAVRRQKDAALPALIEALRDDEIRGKLSADALFSARPLSLKSRRSVSRLRTVLAGDDNAEIRAWAAHVLGRMREHGRGGLRSLRLALSDTEPLVRREAVWAILRILARDSNAQSLLEPALRDEDPRARTRAAIAMYLVARGPPPPIPVILDALRDTDHDVTENAAGIFTGMRERARDALPQLFEMLDDRDARQAAAFAIARIGKHAVDAVPVLADTLELQLTLLGECPRRWNDAVGRRDDRADQREEYEFALGLVEALEKAGPGTPSAIPPLVECLAVDEPMRVRWAELLFVSGRAGLALVEIGSAGVDALVGALASEEAARRFWAAQALETLWPLPDDARSALRKLLVDENEIVRTAATAALRVRDPSD